MYCTLWKALFTMDLKTVDSICKTWGIMDSGAMAMATLQKPFNPKKAVHLQDILFFPLSIVI